MLCLILSTFGSTYVSQLRETLAEGAVVLRAQAIVRSVELKHADESSGEAARSTQRMVHTTNDTTQGTRGMGGMRMLENDLSVEASIPQYCWRLIFPALSANPHTQKPPNHTLDRNRPK